MDAEAGSQGDVQEQVQDPSATATLLKIFMAGQGSQGTASKSDDKAPLEESANGKG